MTERACGTLRGSRLIPKGDTIALHAGRSRAEGACLVSDENGAAAPDPFGSAVADLRAFLAETDREERRLRHELVVLQAKTKRAKRALDALTDDEPKASAKPKTRRFGPASKERQEQVVEALRA